MYIRNSTLPGFSKKIITETYSDFKILYFTGTFMIVNKMFEAMHYSLFGTSILPGLKFCFLEIGGTQATRQSNKKAPRPNSGKKCPEG